MILNKYLVPSWNSFSACADFTQFFFLNVPHSLYFSKYFSWSVVFHDLCTYENALHWECSAIVWEKYILHNQSLLAAACWKCNVCWNTITKHSRTSGKGSDCNLQSTVFFLQGSKGVQNGEPRTETENQNGKEKGHSRKIKFSKRFVEWHKFKKKGKEKKKKNNKNNNIWKLIETPCTQTSLSLSVPQPFKESRKCDLFRSLDDFCYYLLGAHAIRLTPLLRSFVYYRAGRE